MRWNFILLPLMAGVAIWLGSGIYSDAHRDQGRLKVTRQDGQVTLYWAHGIELPMATRFSEAIEKWRGKTQRFVVRLHSPGGSLREGRKVIELLRQLRTTHRVDTIVANSQGCASMCVPIFLQGQSRVSGPDSRFMFHEPYRLGGPEFGSKSQPDWEQRRLSNRFFERYFVNSPMNADWRAELEKVWIGKDIWKTGRELVSENSNIVTSLSR